MIKKLCIATPRLHAGAHTNKAQRQMIILSTLFYWLVGEHVHISPLQYIRGHFLCIDATTCGPIVAGTDLMIEFQGSVNEYVILPTEPLLLNFGPVTTKIHS